MATGQGNQLTRQIGEHLVTAELGRRGIIATPFAGNVPHIDILAYKDGKALPIQVKTINQGAWQFDIRQFLQVYVKAKGDRQKNDGPQLGFDRRLICIFLKLNKNGLDEFYLFRNSALLNHFKRIFKPRIKPHKIDSFHCAIWPEDLKRYKGNWKILIK